MNIASGGKLTITDAFFNIPNYRLLPVIDPNAIHTVEVTVNYYVFLKINLKTNLIRLRTLC